MKLSGFIDHNSHIEKKGFDDLETLLEHNKIASDKDYDDMEKGLKPKTKNYLLSQNLEETRQIFIDEGYEEISDPKKMVDPTLVGKKVRYILKDGRVRVGGRITRVVDDNNTEKDLNDPEFIFLRSFVKSYMFPNGWSVKIPNIQYLYVANINRRKKKSDDVESFLAEDIEEDQEEIQKLKNDFLEKIMKDHQIKNKTRLFDILKSKYPLDKEELGITKVDCNNFFTSNYA